MRVLAIIPLIAICPLFGEDPLDDYLLLKSARLHSINGAALGVGVFKLNDNTYGTGPLAILNVGMTGLKADIGVGSWSSPDGPRKELLRGYLRDVFPFAGITIKASFIRKWDNLQNKNLTFYGRGSERSYYGISGSFSLVFATAEWGWYKSFQNNDHLYIVSYGVGF